MKRINIKGPMVPSSYRWYYDWMKMDYTCASNIIKELAAANGEPVEVYINSPGGVIDVGQEIYTALREYSGDVKIYVTGQACSAASIAAMARTCYMSPVALMMVHRVSTSASGNCGTMEHTAKMLQTADEALCEAYVQKSGMSKEEALQMMEEETWLTAKQALEKGLIDGIIGEEEQPFMNSDLELPSMEEVEHAKAMLDKTKEQLEKAQLNLNLMKMKGEREHV